MNPPNQRPEVLSGLSAAPFIIGIFFFVWGGAVGLNFQLQPNSDQSLRLTDVFGLCSGVWLLFLMPRFQASRLRIAMLVSVGCAFCLIAFNAVSDGNIGWALFVSRIMSAWASCALMIYYSRRYAVFQIFAKGAVLGAVLNTGILLGQKYQIQLFLDLMLADVNFTSVNGTPRYPGLWGHANGAAQVCMASAAFSFLAWPKNEKFYLKIALYLYAASIAYFTIQSRSSVIVGVLVASIFLFTSGKHLSKFTIIFLLALGGTILSIQANLVLSERWVGNFGGMSTYDQIIERLHSTFAGFYIAITHPLGMPMADRFIALENMTGVRAVHNGFIGLILSIGPFLGFYMLCFFLKALFQRNRGHYKFLGLSLGLMLLFEEAINNPSILLSVFIFTAIGVATREPLTRRA